MAQASFRRRSDGIHEIVDRRRVRRRAVALCCAAGVFALALLAAASPSPEVLVAALPIVTAALGLVLVSRRRYARIRPAVPIPMRPGPTPEGGTSIRNTGA